MKKYISTFIGHDHRSTAMTAQNMSAALANDLGYEIIKIAPHEIMGESEEKVRQRVAYALEAVEEDSIFILQLPTWNLDLEYNTFYFEELRKKVKKLVIFIHDFIPLMFENNLGYTEWFLSQYNESDLVILPSKKMEEWMRQYGLKAPVIVQELWDHYTPLSLSCPKELIRRVKFPGSPEKFQIAQSWPQEIDLDIYTALTSLDVPEHVTLYPFLKDEALLQELNKGGFGLVWAENTPNMPTKDYSTMCHSYKLSTYLAAGIPVLVQSGMTASDFLNHNGIGISVDSLEEAGQVVRDISESDYFEMISRLEPISQMVREGFFLKKLLVAVEEKLFIKEVNNDNL